MAGPIYSVPAELDPSFSTKVPEGDNLACQICDTCGFIDYVNPRIIVGAVCTWEDQILLCRRAIEPRQGYWTIPAGFLEEGESTESGTRREAEEEARADIEINALLAIYNIPRISQVQIVYRAVLKSADVSPGPESQEVQLFDWQDIPWDDLAFPSVDLSLEQHHEVRGMEIFAPFTNPPDWDPGARKAGL